MSKNYYDILGVNKTATQEEIKKAYRKKAVEHHPDKGGDENLFKEAAEAYEILSDPDKRKNYDTFGTTERRGSFNMEDIFSQFEDIFSGFGFGHKSSPQKRGSDLRIKSSLLINEVINGAQKKIKYNRQVYCSSCNGTGGKDIITCNGCNGSGKKVISQITPFGRIQQTTVCNECQGEGEKVKHRCVKCHGHGTESKEEIIDINIPPGAINGMQMTMKGYGNQIRNGISGDLYIVIEDIPDSKFKRDGVNLITEEWISISDAVLGSEMEIDSPTGSIKLKIPNGCDSGKIFNIKQRGIPILSHNGSIVGYGDLLIKVNIKIPKILNEKQLDLFSKLKEVL